MNVMCLEPTPWTSWRLKTLPQQGQSFHVLVALEMAMLITVDSCGVLFFIDSHIHGNKGAIIARFILIVTARRRMLQFG